MYILTRKYLKAFLITGALVQALSVNAWADKYFRGMQVANDIDANGIATLAEWNVNLVRYQLIWSAIGDTANESSYNAWLESELQKLDSLIPTFAANKIKILIVLQTPPGGHYAYSPKLFRIFKESWSQNAFIRVWQEMAARYKDTSTVWGYDIVNEPAYDKPTANGGLLDWNGLALETAKQIRLIDNNPNKRIVIEAIYGDIAKLSKLKVFPKSVKGVTYSAHYYYPLSFQEQVTPISYPSAGLNKKKLAQRLSPVGTFLKKVKKATKQSHRFLIGECSANGTAPGASAENYLKDIIALMHAQKMDWLYHAFRESNVWDVEKNYQSGNFVYSPTDTPRLSILKKYFSKNTRK